MAYVGGNIASRPPSTASTMSRTAIHTTWSDSEETSRVTWPAGSLATKNRVS